MGYAKKIDDFETRFSTLNARREVIYLKSDNVGERMVFVHNDPNWKALEAIVSRLGLSAREPDSAMREADRTPLVRDCIAFAKQKPTVDPKLTPGVMMPDGNTDLLTIMEATTEAPDATVDQLWLDEGRWFSRDARGAVRTIKALRSYLTEDHLEDFHDHNSDGNVRQVFNSWIVPGVNAISQLLETCEALQDIFTDRGDADQLAAFIEAKDLLEAQSREMDVALRKMLETLQRQRGLNPFDASTEETEHAEFDMNIARIAQRIQQEISEVESLTASMG